MKITFRAQSMIRTFIYRDFKWLNPKLFNKTVGPVSVSNAMAGQFRGKMESEIEAADLRLSGSHQRGRQVYFRKENRSPSFSRIAPKIIDFSS